MNYKYFILNKNFVTRKCQIKASVTNQGGMRMEKYEFPPTTA